jgi:hypothetical protein
LPDQTISWKLDFVLGFTADEVAPSNVCSFLVNFTRNVYKEGVSPREALVRAAQGDEFLLYTGVVLMERVDTESIVGVELILMSPKALGRPWGLPPFCEGCECVPGTIKVWDSGTANDKESLRIVCHKCKGERTVTCPDWVQPLPDYPNHYYVRFPLTRDQASLAVIPLGCTPPKPVTARVKTERSRIVDRARYAKQGLKKLKRERREKKKAKAMEQGKKVKKAQGSPTGVRH